MLNPSQLTLSLDFPLALLGGSRMSFLTEDRVPVTYARRLPQLRPALRPHNLPVPVGAGNVRVVVRDVFGKETTAVEPFVRYGVTDRLTIEGRGEVMADRAGPCR